MASRKTNNDARTTAAAAARTKSTRGSKKSKDARPNGSNGRKKNCNSNPARGRRGARRAEPTSKTCTQDRQGHAMTAHSADEQKLPVSQPSPPVYQYHCEESPRHFSYIVGQEDPARRQPLCKTAGSEVTGLGSVHKPSDDPHKGIECHMPRPARTWSEVVRGNFTCLPAAAEGDRAEAKQEGLDAKRCFPEKVDGKETCDAKSEKAALERPTSLVADKKVQSSTFGSGDFVIGTQACKGSAPAGVERVQHAGAGMPTSQGAKSDAESIHDGEELLMEEPVLPDHGGVDGSNSQEGLAREENTCGKEIATNAPPGDCTCEKAAQETEATADDGPPHPKQSLDEGSFSRVSKAKRGRRARRRNRKNSTSCPCDASPKANIRLHSESGNSYAASETSSKIHIISEKKQEGVGDQGIEVEGGTSKLHGPSRTDAMDLGEKEQPVETQGQHDGTEEGTGKGTIKGEGDGCPQHADAARDSASETQQVPDPAAVMSNEAPDVWPEKPPGLLKPHQMPRYRNKNCSRFHTQSGRRDKKLHRSASQNLPSVQQPEPIVLHPYTQGLVANSDVHRNYREQFRNLWLGVPHEELEKRSFWPQITSKHKLVSTGESPWGDAFKSARVRLGTFIDEDGYFYYVPLHMPR